MEIQFSDHHTNPILRHEAGEGWHSDGLNAQLLRRIVVREKLGDDMADSDPDEKRDLREELFEQYKRVERAKEELGITDPPPRITESDLSEPMV